ncbi:MAG: BMC domain-containing protein [Synergistaceae bacterium]|jgi:ethanolamine utilization protein EutM|nr:BMC domain-containing protein [Synergistaceae bacterium]
MEALGFIEVVGYVPAIAAADAMTKAASVSLAGAELIGGAMLTVVVKGELGSVRTAVDAGASAAKKTGELVAAHVIAKPSEGLEKLLNTSLK